MSSSTPAGTTIENEVVVSYRDPMPSDFIRNKMQTARASTYVERRPTATPERVDCRVDAAGSSCTTAGELTTGPGTTVGYICPAGDVDWWKFQVNPGETIDGLLHDLPADYGAELIRPDGVPVAQFNRVGLADEAISWWARSSSALSRTRTLMLLAAQLRV